MSVNSLTSIKLRNAIEVLELVKQYDTVSLLQLIEKYGLDEIKDTLELMMNIDIPMNGYITSPGGVKYKLDVTDEGVISTSTDYLYDNFNRADASILGTMATGQTWVPDGESVWGIKANKAYSISGVDFDSVHAETGLTDFEASVEIPKGSANLNSGILLQITPARDKLFVQTTLSFISFFIYTASKNLFSVNTKRVTYVGDTLKLTAKKEGPIYSFYVDDEFLFSNDLQYFSSSYYNLFTSTPANVGLVFRKFSPTTDEIYYDHFLVKPL